MKEYKSLSLNSGLFPKETVKARFIALLLISVGIEIFATFSFRDSKPD